MKPQELISQYQSLIVIGCLVMFVIIGAAFLSPEPAETITAVSQDNQASPMASERELRTGTPKHVPLKIKTKNINSEKWEHDLEIEVTNASDKPIYYLSFMLVFNGIKDDDGNEVRFWLHYGRGPLNDFSTPVENTDVPIQPNEVCILKIPESDVTSWEITRTKKKYPPPTKLGLIFQVLNFGDGTGFADSGGTPVNIHKKIGSNEKCLSPPDPFTISKTDELSFIPAAFAPVNFSSKVFSKSFVRSSSPAFDWGVLVVVAIG